MSDDAIVIGALVAAREYLLQAACPEAIYGFFHGGDPRNFSPDEEASTEEERALHKAHCEAWERGEHASTTMPQCCRGDGSLGYGLGTNMCRDEDAEDVLAQVYDALSALGVDAHGTRRQP